MILIAMMPVLDVLPCMQFRLYPPVMSILQFFKIYACLDCDELCLPINPVISFDNHHEPSSITLTIPLWFLSSISITKPFYVGEALAWDTHPEEGGTTHDTWWWKHTGATRHAALTMAARHSARTPDTTRGNSRHIMWASLQRDASCIISHHLPSIFFSAPLHLWFSSYPKCQIPEHKR